MSLFAPMWLVLDAGLASAIIIATCCPATLFALGAWVTDRRASMWPAAGGDGNQAVELDGRNREAVVKTGNDAETTPRPWRVIHAPHQPQQRPDRRAASRCEPFAARRSAGRELQWMTPRGRRICGDRG